MPDQYTQRNMEMGMLTETVKGQRTMLALETDPARIASLTRSIDNNTKEYRRLERLNRTRSDMTKYDSNYQKAVQKLADGLAKTAADLQALEAERPKLPAAYYATERGRLIEAARAADLDANRTITEYQDLALRDAATLRARAEADIPAAERTALLLEQQTLTASKLDGDAFVDQARDAIRAGRSRRAEMLLNVAETKGSRGVAQLRAVAQLSLDVEDETRAQAAAIEDAVQTNVIAYRASRTQVLRDSGLGMTSDGGVGTGGSSEVANASISLKMEAATAVAPSVNGGAS
jgi:hypothetical protein